MKKIAAMLALVMMVGVFAPAVMADEMSDVLLSVKSRVHIPEECTEFNAYPQTNDGKKEWAFNWITPEGAETEKNVNVNVNEDGIITSYYLYDSARYNSFGERKILPAFSEEEALNKAREVMRTINPSIHEKYDFDKAQVILNPMEYSIFATRVVNGIEFISDSANIAIDHRTGNVVHFSLSYDADVVFPPAENIISVDDAAAAFQKYGGLETIYTTFFDEENEEKIVKVVYAPTGKGRVIDALNGEIADIEQYDIYPYYGYAEKSAMAADQAMAGGAANIRLTEKEIEGIEKLSGIISEKEAEAKVRSMTELDLDADLKMRSSRVTTFGEEDYQIYLYFENFDNEKHRSANASLNARTGELISFYSYSYREYNPQDKDKKIDEEAMKAAAQAVLNKYYGSYQSKVQFKSGTAQKYDNFYSVIWNRVENGLPYYLNEIGISVNMENKKISSLSLNWDNNLEFKSAGDIISGEEAYGKLFEVVTPKLCYMLEKAGAEEKTVRLVYAINTNEVAFVDAESGKLLNSIGKEYTPDKKVSYSDLEGHYAKEAVEALAKIGAYLEGSEFLPDKIITQSEYLQLVSKCVWDYYPLYGGRVDAASIYKNAIANGVIKKDEEAPDSPLTRELAVTYLLRAMGYKKFAEIKGIFKCSFIDQSEIDEEMFGYVAIAEGLQIINGFNGAFMPKREMTRAEAITVLHNYLNK